MDNTKKVLMSVIAIAGAIYEIYSFYKKHEKEIKAIIDPAVDACKEVKDVVFFPETI